MKVGFIGLGVMGLSMAGHILEKLGSVVVWNRTAEKAAPLIEKGAELAGSPSAVAEECDIVCICVADTPDVEAVVFGKGGVYTGLSLGKLVIDFSTISAETTEELARRVAEKGASWIDAPVSGGDVGARNGTLTIMAGGSEEDFNRARPIFEAVGKTIVYMGLTGSGQRTKMANQIAVCGTILSMSEALTFAQKSGMDVEKVLSVISTGAAGSWSLSNYGPRLLKGDDAPGFSVRLMAKDLRIVAEALEKIDGVYTATDTLTALFRQMVQNGEGDNGIQTAAKHLGWERD